MLIINNFYYLTGHIVNILQSYNVGYFMQLIMVLRIIY